MNKNVRNTITGLIGLSLTLGSAGAVGAASVSDLAGHWAEKQMQEWIGKGDLNGYTDGSVKPNKSITRSEFIALVNRMFKNTETTPIHFADLPETNWAYTDISKAIKAGYLQGYENNTIRPNANVTRQEAASIISKVVGLKSGDLQSLNQYKDASQISAWSKDSVAAVVEKDIMKGYQDGTFAPQKILTRAEAVVLIDAALNKKKLMETVTYDKSGVYGSTQETKIIEGNVVISVPGVSLENVEIKGDLLLAEGIGSGDVTLKNVKVHGTTNVQGGGENSIHFVDSVLVNIVIDKKDGTVRIVAEGTTTAKTVVVKSAAKVEESNVSGVGFTDVELSKELPANAKVVLNGTFDEVDVFAASITVQLTRGSIDSFHVEGTAQNSSIQLSSEAKIINLVLDAVAKLLGSGQIQKAQINDGAKGSTFEKKPDTVEGSAKDSVVVSTPVAPSTPSTGSSSGGSSSGGSTGGGGTTSPTPDVDQQEANKVSSLITALSAIDKLTLADENDVYKTNEAFKALSIKQQALVSEANQTKLTDAVAKIAELKAAAERDQAAADAVTAKIVALPEEITLKNEEEVAAAQAAYEDLTAEQKSLVAESNQTKLTGAVAKIAELKATAERDQQAADAVTALIVALPEEITLENEEKVAAAQSAYEDLTAEQKSLVAESNQTKLTGAVAKIAELKATAERDQQAADAVTALIVALPEEITLENEEKVAAAQSAYEDLTAEQKSLVAESNQTKLTGAVAKIAELKATAERDQQAADAVTALIVALPEEITLENEEKVAAAQAAYAVLTAEQKALVAESNQTKLTGAVAKIAELKATAERDQQAADAVTALIVALPEEITLENEEKVAAAQAAYTVLTAEQKALVAESNQTKLTGAVAKIAELKATAERDQQAADAVTAKIVALPEEITLENEEKVAAAQSAYEDLTAEQKSLVAESNQTKLTGAVAKIAELKATAERDQQAADAVTALIVALPEEITLENEEKVAAAQAAYAVLTAEQKSLVAESNQTKLTGAVAKIAELKATAERDQQAADAVTALIVALPEEITLENEEKVAAAQAAYAVLTAEQKSLVAESNQTKLTGAVAKIAELKATAERDQQAADAVTALIVALPEEITLENEEKVAAAQAAYAVLTAEQKSLVAESNQTKLTGAVAKIAELKATAERDQQAADAVTALIVALPEEITLENEEKVAAAQSAYEDLTAEQKALVAESNQTKLTGAVSKIAELKATAERDQAAAEEVTAKIVALPEEITLENEEEVTSAQAAYAVLTEEQKALVLEVNYTKLTAAVEKIAELKAEAERD